MNSRFKKLAKRTLPFVSVLLAGSLALAGCSGVSHDNGDASAASQTAEKKADAAEYLKEYNEANNMVATAANIGFSTLGTEYGDGAHKMQLNLSGADGADTHNLSLATQSKYNNDSSAGYDIYIDLIISGDTTTLSQIVNYANSDDPDSKSDGSNLKLSYDDKTQKFGLTFQSKPISGNPEVKGVSVNSAYTVSGVKKPGSDLVQSDADTLKADIASLHTAIDPIYNYICNGGFSGADICKGYTPLPNSFATSGEALTPEAKKYLQDPGIKTIAKFKDFLMQHPSGSTEPSGAYSTEVSVSLDKVNNEISVGFSGFAPSDSNGDYQDIYATYKLPDGVVGKFGLGGALNQPMTLLNVVADPQVGAQVIELGYRSTISQGQSDVWYDTKVLYKDSGNNQSGASISGNSLVLHPANHPNLVGYHDEDILSFDSRFDPDAQEMIDKINKNTPGTLIQ